VPASIKAAPNINHALPFRRLSIVFLHHPVAGDFAQKKGRSNMLRPMGRQT
jgi:hypothetical protein